MLGQRGICAGLLLLTLSSVGCVDRRFTVRTNVPYAQVYQDGVLLGPSPLDNHFEYPGTYEFRAVAPGYQPVVQREYFKPRWFDYPGLDLFAEVFWPFRIEDVRVVDIVLQPSQPQRVDELQNRAEQLRMRGMSLPPSTVVDEIPPPNQ